METLVSLNMKRIWLILQKQTGSCSENVSVIGRKLFATEIKEQDTCRIIVIGVASIVPHIAFVDSLMDAISFLWRRTRRRRLLMRSGRFSEHMQYVNEFISLILCQKSRNIGTTLDECRRGDARDLIDSINRSGGILLIFL